MDLLNWSYSRQLTVQFKIYAEFESCDDRGEQCFLY